jgi:hypothetical protein
VKWEMSIFSNTNLLDTPPNPTRMIYSCLSSEPLSRFVDGPAMVTCEVTQLHLETDSWGSFTDNANKDRIPFTPHQCKPHFASAMRLTYMALRN